MDDNTGKISICVDDGILTIKLKGEMVFSTKVNWEDEIFSAIEKNRLVVLFDLSECKYVASYGYAVFLRIRRMCNDFELKLAICGCNEMVKKGFLAVGFNKLTSMFNNHTEARKYLLNND